MENSIEIIPNFHQIRIGRANTYLITEKELTLIDCGYIGSTIRIANSIRNLRRSIEEVTLIILTHNHFDHISGLAELQKITRAKVAAHKADIISINNQSSYPWFMRRLLHMPPFSALKPLFLTDSSRVDIQLMGSEILSPLGGLKVIHTPGHTPGSISLYSFEKKLLIVGDALRKRRQNPYMQYNIVSNDIKQALNSVKQISQLDFDIICFGHGRPIAGNASAKVRDLLQKYELS